MACNVCICVWHVMFVSVSGVLCLSLCVACHVCLCVACLMSLHVRFVCMQCVICWVVADFSTTASAFCYYNTQGSS